MLRIDRTQRFRKKEDPFDAANRRISLIVQYLRKPEPAAGAAGNKAAEAMDEKKTEIPEWRKESRHLQKTRNANEQRFALYDGETPKEVQFSVAVAF